jgi:tetratricopeptide (TPR) repeat protein
MFTMTTPNRSSALTEWILLGLVVSALLGFSSPQEISLEEQELLLRLTQQFSEAQKLFEDPQRQSQSIEFFSQIRDAIDDERRARGEVSEDLAKLEEEVLEYRARAFFNAGQMQGAADDFRQLIFKNPRKTLDAEALSPKIIDFFEDLKNSLVGKIAVSSEPAGARVTVGGEFVGITNFFPVEVHTGMQRVEITLEGYDSIVYDEVRILPGEVQTLDVTLVRNSAKVPIITQPAGVEVWVDGELVDKTSGSLPPDLRSFMPPGVDPNQLSAPLDLSALPLGRHTIELRKECYEPVRFPFDAEEPKDYSALIQRLVDSVAQLQVSSNPPGARVFLDGEYRGNTPLDLNRVCSGAHHLEVKHSATGKYVEDIVLEKNEVLSLECPIRPTLAFLGLVAEEGVPARDIADMREVITAELRKLEVMNLVFPEPTQLRSLLGRTGVAAFVSNDLLPEGSETPAETVRDLSEKLGETLEAEALLVGYVPDQRLVKDVVINFLAVSSTTPDTYVLNYLDRQALSSLVERLSEPTPLFKSWIGMTSIDTRITAGPIVLSVAPDGPAAAGGVEIGDVVIEADTATIQQTLEMLEWVGSKTPGDSVVLKVERGGSSREVRLEVGRTPVEVPLNRPDFLYNKAMVDLKHRIVVDPDNEPLARLNLALCHMELGNYETALKEHFPKINFGTAAQGISQGTAFYYQGLAYMKLDEPDEAARMFDQAMKYTEATLQSNDGPRVAPLAEMRLREMGR